MDCERTSILESHCFSYGSVKIIIDINGIEIRCPLFNTGNVFKKQHKFFEIDHYKGYRL